MNPFEQTTWTNPTSSHVTFTIFEGPGRKFKIDVPPGKDTTLPSQYDNDVRTVRNSVVVGGLAPQLIVKGQTKIPMLEALAKAAEYGDVERRVVEATGVSAGALTLDAASKLHAENKALQARLAELEARFASSSVEQPKGAQEQPTVAEKAGAKTK